MDNAHPWGVPREVVLRADNTPACFHDSLFSRQACARKSVNCNDSPDANSIADAFSRFNVGNALLRSTMATKVGCAALTLELSLERMARTSVLADLPARKAD
eukprot:1241227-Amphidinium_carterae.1